MIDFPIDDLMNEAGCLVWLERHLHPAGLRCPRCGASERRPFRPEATFPAFRCKPCDRYYTILTGTVFAKTHQPPRKLGLLLRGIAQGETTARLTRALGLSDKQAQTLRHRVQHNLYATLPSGLIADTVFEADELDQNAGEKRDQTSRSRRPAAAPRQ